MFSPYATIMKKIVSIFLWNCNWKRKNQVVNHHPSDIKLAPYYFQSVASKTFALKKKSYSKFTEATAQKYSTEKFPGKHLPCKHLLTF